MPLLTRIQFALVVGVVVGCSSPPPTPDDAGDLDAFRTDSGGGLRCDDPSDCDDGLFCNGPEVCASGVCGPGTAPTCESGRACDEAVDGCVLDCVDADGDGANDAACGGTDCDDTDERRTPTASEVCDTVGLDEDCDTSTLGTDVDGDGFVASRCCNRLPAGRLDCGLDCNDSDAAVNPAQIDPCGGGDQDCDGAVDENPDQTFYRDVDGDGHGIVTDVLLGCSAPSGYAVIAGDCDDARSGVNPGVPERCNLIDDNCTDGTDEGCGCTPEGASETCGPTTEAGECLLGARTCVAGTWSSCSGAIYPDTEVCEGNFDENCDGEVDDGCECTNGSSRICGMALGVCRSTAQSCTGGTWPRDCADEPGVVWPGTEACDGTLDEDCDGAIDEGCTCVDGAIDRSGCGTDVGECATGMRTCAAGAWGACSGGVASVVEVCEGSRDEDCDAATDEGCACINGEVDRTACGTDIGECERGMRTCATGAWGACAGGIAVSPESCEGSRDEDCDGATDEGCACVNGAVDRSGCGTDVGECTSGMRTCAAGAWGACSGGVGAGVEACEGSRDEDCDGATDEGCSCTNGATRGCGTGACAGTQTCSSGGWGACSGAAPGVEICNGIDDDCDGMADSTDSGVSMVGASCGTDVGLCTAGSYSCPGSALVCSGAAATTEVCDHRDQDCDGLLDDGVGVVGCSISRVDGGTPSLTSEFLCSWGTCSGIGDLIEFATTATNDPGRIAVLRATELPDWGRSMSATARFNLAMRSATPPVGRYGVIVSPVSTPGPEAVAGDNAFPILTGTQRGYAAVLAIALGLATIELWELTPTGNYRRAFNTGPSACFVDSTTRAEYRMTLSNDAGNYTARLDSSLTGCTGITATYTVASWQSLVYGDSESVPFPRYQVGAYGDPDGYGLAELARFDVTRTRTTDRGHCVACPW